MGYFIPAFYTDEDKAVRILQWARDVRGGAGERDVFRAVLVSLAYRREDVAHRLIPKVPELGRWDDLLVLVNSPVWPEVVELIRQGLEAENGLCAKWMPRKGEVASKLRNALGWTPKFYRKRLVELTNVVEQKMCANEWDNINFSHVPSVAHNKYRRAFARNSANYTAYLDALERGDDGVHVNAGAIFPHDIVNKIANNGPLFRMIEDINIDRDERRSIVEQWAALPNYIKDANVLPIIDVSGSMFGGMASVRPIDVSIGLGLYFADKNEGKFKDTFLTFSSSPELVHLKGDIVDKVQNASRANWAMSTDLHAAFQKILNVAEQNNLPQSEMPDTVFILSDMQFNACVRFDDSANEMIKRKYAEAGYKVPNVVFWNLNSAKNAPVSFNEKGVALVSGFSPAICKSILEGVESGDLSPERVMERTIMDSRYDW